MKRVKLGNSEMRDDKMLFLPEWKVAYSILQETILEVLAAEGLENWDVLVGSDTNSVRRRKHALAVLRSIDKFLSHRQKCALIAGAATAVIDPIIEGEVQGNRADTPNSRWP